ncbi:MAG: serine hydrolase [Dehalococcoidales bacterium]|nr:serine hydrolase [Dehalococcoidales bacterium]
MNEPTAANPGKPLTTVPGDDEIRRIISERVDKRHQSVGMVVGVVNNKERRVIAHGCFGAGDSRPVNGDTVYEIGSITKVFTSLLLADMVQRGEIALDDPVAKYLPATVRMPERNWRVITLIDLATHTSGLPRMPDNMSPQNPLNPYADYTVEQLYQFLSNYQLTRDIGAQFEYSNLAVGLLGHVLARRADTDYETLVRSRICQPLGMKATRITLTPDMKARLAVGHDAALNPVANWDLPTLAGAGALRSTVNDLLIFLAAVTGITETSLSPAIVEQLKVRRPVGGGEMGLGWGISSKEGNQIIWHNGGTAGYMTWLGYRIGDGVGAVVLSNAACPPDDIGFHLLNTGIPLAQPPLEHVEVKVDSGLLEGYVGKYQLQTGLIVTMIREGDYLFAQPATQPRSQLSPESDRVFYLAALAARITFVVGEDGRATGLSVSQSGAILQAKRVE